MEYKFGFTFFINDANEICSITSVAMTSMGEKGEFTEEEIAKLRLLMNVFPQPDFSKRKPLDDRDRQDRLVKYGNALRDLVKSLREP